MMVELGGMSSNITFPIIESHHTLNQLSSLSQFHSCADYSHGLVLLHAIFLCQPMAFIVKGKKMKCVV